jgi:pyochelin biosynthesis protein PchC
MKSIFLLPYGGGSAASYRSYANKFPREAGRVVPVEIPGRGKRSHEEYAKSIQDCAARALEEIDTEGETYIIHGHCMGALLAFEAIKLIEASGRQLPVFMLASGRNAPRHINDWLRRVPEMDDRSLFQELQEFGGIPRGLSFAMAQHFLTVLRNDQAMIRDYEPGETRISVPILVLASRDDKMTTPAGVADWEEYTSKFVSIEWLDGQHYSFLAQPDRVARYVDEFCNVVDSFTPKAFANSSPGFEHRENPGT